MNAFKKYEQYFKQNGFISFLWVWKLLWISVFSVVNKKQLAKYQHQEEAKSLSSVFLSLVYYNIIFRHASLINTETLNLKQFWICVKLGQVWPLKADETHSLPTSFLLSLNKLHILSSSLNSWVTKQSIQHLQYWR